MSVPVVSVTISGMDTPEVLEQNLAMARSFEPLSAQEMQAIRDRCRFEASDGRYEFKTTKKYDGDVGREMHGYPSASQLPV